MALLAVEGFSFARRVARIRRTVNGMSTRAVLVGSAVALLAVVGGMTGLSTANAMVAPDPESTTSVTGTAEPSVVPTAATMPANAAPTTSEVAVTATSKPTTTQTTVAPKPVPKGAKSDPVTGQVFPTEPPVGDPFTGRPAPPAPVPPTG